MRGKQKEGRDEGRGWEMRWSATVWVDRHTGTKGKRCVRKGRKKKKKRMITAPVNERAAAVRAGSPSKSSARRRMNGWMLGEMQ
jgi:hypothetical protein